MKKKTLALVLTTAMAASMIAGCGSSASSSGTGSTTASADTAVAEETKAEAAAEPAASDEVVTLYVVDWESDTMNEAMQAAFDEIFSAEHPNIKVEIIEGSYSDYNQQMNAMITAGEAPDVFQLGYDQACSFFRKNLLTDWTDKVAEEPEFVKGFYGGTMQGWQYKGSTYGFPGLVNVYGVFYNKDLLAAAGLEEPKAGWTWDDFFAYGEALKDPASNKYGIYGLDASCFGVANISTSEGGAAFVDDLTNTTKVTVDDTFLETAEKISGLIADGVIPNTSYETANQLSMFEAGEMAMIYYGQWEVDSLIRNCPDLNWGYAPTPVGSAKATTIYDTVGWVSPKDLPHPEETWELIKFMSSDMYESVLKATPVAACAHEASADVFYEVMEESGHPDAAEAVEAMMSVEDKNAVRYAADWSDDAGKVWNTDWNNFMDGVSGASSETLKELAEKVNAVIEAN